MNNSDSSHFHPVCRVGDITDGHSRMFVVAETMIGIFNVAGSFFALANECPHAGASLAHGIMEEDCIRCRIHHWKFSIRDGTYLDEDNPRYNVATFPVRIVGDQVQVEIKNA